MQKLLVLSALLCAVPLPGFAAGTDERPSAPAPAPKPAASADYDAGKAAVERGDWKTAIELLDRAASREPRNANIQNYLGFANRNAGNWETAMNHYRSALSLDPNHRGANEYVGRAYLMRGNLALAEEHLGKLEKICGRGCSEYASLSSAIAEYRKNPK
jgi:Flp pilus assembly protein TadD